MAVIAADERIKRFLDLIAYSEGTSTSPITKDRGYDVIVSGIHGPSIFTDYSTHPLIGKSPIVVKENPLSESTAAGRYQLLRHYYEIYKVQLKLPDFSPLSQDTIALQQIRERHAINMILANNVTGAIMACSNIWASFPGNDYAQGGKSLKELLDNY